MQGFHVEEPALQSDISSLNPVIGSVGHEHTFFSSYLKQEGLSLGGVGGKLQSPHISSSAYPLSKLLPFAEERGHFPRPDGHFGGVLFSPAEINNRDVNILGNTVAEKKDALDEYSCRDIPLMVAMEGTGKDEVGNASISDEASKLTAYLGALRGYARKQGDTHFGLDHVSIAAPLKSAKMDYLLGYSGFEVNEGDYVQDSIATFLKNAGQQGRVQEPLGGNHTNNLHASMAPLTCDSPRDDRFWRFLPSNNQKHSMDHVSSDEFCMFEFKVRRCMRGRSHDWTECPFAHPGEKARRRDPRCFNYSGMACPDFRRGTCRRGDLCEFSHGVFECWLHPARYRTQLCKDGKACKRRVCFFAHSASQLRVVSPDKNAKHSLKMPDTLAADGISVYRDTLQKQPMSITRQASSVGNDDSNGYGDMNGWGADLFFPDFSPRSMHRNSQDGAEEEGRRMGAHRRGINHSERASLDLETFNVKQSFDHLNRSFKDSVNIFELNSPQDHIHAHFPVFGEEFRYGSGAGNVQHFSNSTPPFPLDNSSRKGDRHIKSQLAITSLKGSLDQILSPTSTLIGNIFSPPLLSPPLSPAESPPLSSSMGFPALGSTSSQRQASHPTYSLPYDDGLAQSFTSGVDVTHSSSGKYGLSAHASTRAPSLLSAAISRSQRENYVEGLDAMQSAVGNLFECVQASSTEGNASKHAMAHLLTTLQQMELRASVDMSNWNRSLPRGMEEGQGFRGDVNGNENYTRWEEIENPDFGWVNELVK